MSSLRVIWEAQSPQKAHKERLMRDSLLLAFNNDLDRMKEAYDMSDHDLSWTWRTEYAKAYIKTFGHFYKPHGPTHHNIKVIFDA